jgi:predicted site-specific integrase-resolvase
MRLRDYAKKMGVTYKTAWLWWKAGKLSGYQLDTGTIIITDGSTTSSTERGQRVAVYTRVSAAENKPNLNAQADRLVAYCVAKGYQVQKVVKEVGSGVNDSRPKLLALLEDTTISIIVVEQKDRLTRFGFRYIETLLRGQGRQVEVVNQADNQTEDLLADLTSIIYSFCARLYGQRRARRKTEKIVAELEANGNDHATD